MSRRNPSGENDDRSARTVSSSSRQNGGNRSFFGKSIGGIAVLALVGLYAVAQPLVNERMGWNLPELRPGSDGQVSVVESNSNSNSPSARSIDAKPGMSKGPSADRMRPSGSSTSAKTTLGRESGSAAAQSKLPAATRAKLPAATRAKLPAATRAKLPAATRATADRVAKDSDLLHGLLREIGSKRYISPAGLLYTPGSAEGHRLEHLRRHTEDQPNRPGSHGVFDGGMEGALKTIDLAYERAKKGQRTTKQVDDGRIIYTVDMGGRVGFVGGSDGGRRRNPMARRVRLILEDTRVITAYPM